MKIGDERCRRGGGVADQGYGQRGWGVRVRVREGYQMAITLYSRVRKFRGQTAGERGKGGG